MYVLISRQLGLVLPLDLSVVVERLSVAIVELVLALLGGSDTLQLAALVRLAVPLLGPDITSLVSGTDNEDAVAQLNGAGLATVHAAAVDAELFGVLLDQFAGSGRPLFVAGGSRLLNKSQAVLGHGLDGLAVQRRLGDGLKLLEGAAVKVEQG